MLKEALPFAAVSWTNPIFRYATREIRWVNNEHKLQRYSLLMFTATVLVVAAWWLVVVVANALYPGYGCISMYSYVNYCVEGAGSTVLAIAALASIGAGLLLDFACLISSLNSIGSEFTRRRWDLLRLTPLRIEEIITAKHALSQIRAWRLMIVVIGMRVAVVLVSLLQIFVLPPLIGREDTFDDFVDGFIREPFMMIFLLVTLTIFCGVAIVEPLWRMRALTALGIALSARFRGLMTASLIGLAALIVVWVSQTLIMGFVWWLMFTFISGLSFGGTASAAFGMLCILTFCAGTGFIIYWYYKSLEAASLRRAAQYAFSEQ